MKKSIFVCLALILLLSSGCQSTSKKKYEADFLQLFDTVTKIVGYADNKKEFTKQAEEIKTQLNVYHQLYDIYHDYKGINNIKTINDHAGKSPVIVDRKIIDLLLFAKEEDQKTNGACNIALGSVLTIWHQYREAGIDDPENAKLPSVDELLSASKHTDIQNVIIDEKASTVYLSDPLMSLDVGAVAKGYATERVARYMESIGVHSLLLSVGGNVRAIGGKITEKNGKASPWNVGIQNPDSKVGEESLLYVNVTDESVVTSGIYERYYMVDGVRYHHIIDPKTLFPSAYFTAITILTHDSGLADALSTAVFNMPLDQGKAYIRSLPNTEALWVMPDGTIVYSDHFKEYIHSDSK